MTTFSLVIALLLIGPPDAAEPDPHHLHQPAQQRLSFDESIGASEVAPIVVGLTEAAEQKRDRDRDIPRQSQNPQVLIMPGARVNAGPGNGFELQTMFTQGWNVEGFGRARRTAATADTDVIEARARARALEQRFGAADAWIRLHGAELRLAMAKADLQVAEQLVATLTQAREAGEATRLDVAEAEAIAAEAEAAVVELGGEVHDLGLVLARETGTKTSNPLGTRGDYPNPPLPEDDELRRRFAEVDKLPAVQLRRVQARAALAEARATERENGTVLNAGASVNVESSNEVLVFGVVGANLATFDRNQRGQANAHAQAREAEAEAEQIAIELSAALGIALHELRHTRERVELLRDRSLPALDELIVARAAAFELGEATRAQLLAAQHRRNVVARELAAAEAEHAWARVQVWLYLDALTAEAE